MNNPQKIILHHSLTKDSGTVSWQAIRRYHENTLKWGSIGYHFGIEWVQDQHWSKPHVEILLGRFVDESGIHTPGQNSQSIGICMVGNFDIEEPPEEIWYKTLNLVRWLMKAYLIERSNIFGHRDFSSKTCPGLKWDMEKFREMIYGDF